MNAEHMLSESQISEENEKEWIYMVGVHPPNLLKKDEENCDIDFFLEISPEDQDEALTKFLVDDFIEEKEQREYFKNHTQLSLNISMIKMRMHIHNDMVCCLFRTKFRLDRDQMRDYIRIADREEIQKAIIRL